MPKNIQISSYHTSILKRFLDIFLSLIILPITLPIFVIIAILIKITSRGPILFEQERAGKDGKIFTMLKFRSMCVGAERLQKKYLYLNEADGPVFKIRYDPRFTWVGRILSGTGLDELPQFINVLRGEMSIVGPRPLPVYEFKKLSKGDQQRGLIKPGITSLWVTGGAHNLKFKIWMDLDKEYVRSGSLWTDLLVVYKTATILTIGRLKQTSPTS